MLFSDSKDDLWEYRDELSARLAVIRLRLHQDKTRLSHREEGLKFLGFVLKPQGRRLQQAVLRRFNRRLRRLRWLYARGLISSARVRQSLQAWTAHTSWANAVGIRRALWRRVRFARKKPP